MIKRDHRYTAIKSMVEAGELVSFNQIFKIIPKTVVAKDLGKKVDRFNILMTHVDEFTLQELFRIAQFCRIDEDAIFKLILYDYRHSKNGNDRST
jgi:hypothetical protein